MQLEHACELLLQSELFAFHSERMCGNIVDEVQKVCNNVFRCNDDFEIRCTMIRLPIPTSNSSSVAFYSFMDANKPVFSAPTNDGSL